MDNIPTADNNSPKDNNWKILIATIIVIVMIVFFAIQKSVSNNQPTPVVAPEIQLAIPPSSGTQLEAQVSGNIDDLTNILTKEADSDAALLNDGINDVTLVKSDVAEITNLGSSYDETAI